MCPRPAARVTSRPVFLNRRATARYRALACFLPSQAKDLSAPLYLVSSTFATGPEYGRECNILLTRPSVHNTLYVRKI